jgi:two-component system response regulator GlrR
MKARPLILAVDDDPALLQLLSMRLDIEGFTVVEASSGEEALAKLATCQPHLVITDMQMGGMDGVALFESVQRSHPTLPVIILTAHGSVAHAVEALRRGVFGYLTKPFEAANLLVEVTRALGQSGGAGAGLRLVQRNHHAQCRDGDRAGRGAPGSSAGC